MPDFETGDSRESVANPSPLIDSIRSLVKFAPVLAALLAVSACNKGDNPELQACQIDSAKLEGILSGLNVDPTKMKGDSDPSGDSDGDRLHACEVRKARLIGLSQGVEKVQLSPGDQTRAKDREELRQRWLDESLAAARNSGNPWGGFETPSIDSLPQNLKDKGFYYKDGLLRRQNFDGTYFLENDGGVIYLYPDNTTMKRLPPGGDPDSTWPTYSASDLLPGTAGTQPGQQSSSRQSESDESSSPTPRRMTNQELLDLLPE